MNRAVSFTVRELWERGKNDIPPELISSTHLIYSSPATLAFNSPGAEGFGVKRAGLSVPGSVMLIVSPGCCGRNTSSISSMEGYENRFFYLTMDETDLVTGRHLRRIPQAVVTLAAELEVKPSVIMICITCVDALLGTDMERVCRKAEALLKDAGMQIRVRPSYMYALTREGRKPPMVHVRQSIYSLLEPVAKKADSVNIMGFFAPLDSSCELRDLLRSIGVKKIREVSTCEDYNDFLKMAEANFNLILNPEARPAAQDLEEKLGTASIELTRLYQIDRIAAQYDALGAALGVRFSYDQYMETAKESMKRFRSAYPDAEFSVGEALNADPFELALALVRYGFAVREIFGTVTKDSYRYLRHLAVLSPTTRVYSNLSPSMLLYGEHEDEREKGRAPHRQHISIGRDAGWYHPNDPCLQWVQDIQPFGFMGVMRFFDALMETVKGKRKDMFTSVIRLGEDTAAEAVHDAPKSMKSADQLPPKGYRKVLTPFAPDQSGAVSVLYELGGITVICDAGGCTGNICGFDEPRWFGARSAVLSAGLRDMDAILGRDERLVQKLADTAAYLQGAEGEKAPRFAAIIGTPVPAVIGTDFKALERMAEKRTGLVSLGIACDGMEFYDKGAQDTYMALFSKFSGPADRSGRTKTGSGNQDEEAGCRQTAADRIGILGAQYMDLSGIAEPEDLREKVKSDTGCEVLLFGSGKDGIEAFREAGTVRENIVVTVSGYEAALYLSKKYAVPFRCCNPLIAAKIREEFGDGQIKGKRVLVIHEQITGSTCRDVLRECGASLVHTASWFMMKDALKEDGDVRLREESDLLRVVSEKEYDLIMADPVMLPIIRERYRGDFYALPHFAVSGKR